MDSSPPFQQQQQRRSPFLSDIDTPVHSQGSDHPGSSSPFTSFADFNTSAALDDSLSIAANPSVPPTPFTPSFAAQAGSYQNSPLGSDISYIPGNEFPQHSPNPNTFSAGDFDISVLPPEFIGDDYDPTVYDAPADSSLFFGNDFMASLNEQANSQSKTPNQNSSPSLSTSSLGSNSHGVSVSVTPAPDNPMGNYGSSYDQGSPASSAGDNNDYQHQANDVTCSRGSSVSSQPNEFQSSATLGLEGVHLDTSPNPSQGHSPSWATQGLSQGAQSPPHIYIPGQTPEMSSVSPQPSPSPSNRTLAPDGGASVLPPGGIGMGIQIVPATPISAGVDQGGPFQHVDLSNQGRASPANPQSQPWGGQTNQQQQQTFRTQSRGTSPLPRLPQAPPSQYSFPPNAALTPPHSAGSTSLSLNGNSGNAGTALAALDLSRDSSPERSGAAATDGNFLIPISNPRLRSKSETSLRPQLWQMGVSTGYEGQTQNQSQGQVPGLQMDGTSYGQQQLPRLNTPLHMPAPFGPPTSGLAGFDGANASGTGNTNNNFLSPDFALGVGVGASDLRRARSESQGHRRNALSADMTPIFADRTGLTGQSPFYQPSNRPNDPFLSPGQTTGLAGINISGGGLGLMGAGGHGGHRRSLSHGGSGHSHSRSLSRERVSLSASPYPSPHASPRVTTNELLPDTYPYPSTSTNYGIGQNGGAPTVHVMSHDAQGRPTVQTQAPITVVRQNVTTHATADASQRRRRTEANFVCPVPGCGSTFTRHFNLKGHMRSHNEERPFKCKWPGCDKGFARQHDCKRHEQLHLNIRPYTCQGCKRTFARMDALNRHLRSDAGTDCQAIQPILTSDMPNNPDITGNGEMSKGSGAMTGTLTLKAEDPSWRSSTAAGSVMV